MSAKSNDIAFKHFFTPINGKIYWENEEMLNYALYNGNGKRQYAVIYEWQEEISSDYYSFYFGGIIRGECMNSNCFASLTHNEIHEILFSELRSYTVAYKKPDGTAYTKIIKEDFSKYKKKDMQLYVEELIPHLKDEYNIHVKEREKYHGTNKFVHETKIVKHDEKKGFEW